MSRLFADIFSHPFAIMPDYARASAPLIKALLEGRSTVSAEEAERRKAENKPFAISGGLVYATDLLENPQDVPESSVAILPYNNVVLKNNGASGIKGTKQLALEIKAADKNDNIIAILVDADSPGGTVDYADIVADVVSNTDKPILFYCGGVMCSAMYYIGAGADKIIAGSPHNILGSIGVMTTFRDDAKFWEAKGINWIDIYATKSTEKNRIYERILEGEEAAVDEYRLKHLDPLNESFIAHVKKSRPMLKEEDGVLNGAIFYGVQAKELGLIDDIMTFDSAVELARQLGEEYQKSKAPANTNSDNQKSTIQMSNKTLTIPQAAADLLGDNIQATESGFVVAQAGMDELITSIQASSDRIQALEQELETAQAAAANANSLIEALGCENLEEANARIEELNTMAESSDGKQTVGKTTKDDNPGEEKDKDPDIDDKAYAAVRKVAPGRF